MNSTTNKHNLIYCAGGNRKYADIAVRYGFACGAQLPDTVYHPLAFADQNYHKPTRRRYMNALKKHRPAMATVLDYEAHCSFEEIMNWATEAAWYVPEVIIIPKVPGTIDRIPHTIGKAKVRLGYSVESGWGKTAVDFSEFGNRPVHLLGGEARKQFALRNSMNVQSADWNDAHKHASRNRFFTIGETAARNKHYPMLNESVYGDVKTGAPYLAFELSCMNIKALWAGCNVTVRFAVETDLTGIKKLANGYKQELGYVMLPALRESIQRRNLVIAEDGGQVVGFVNYRACQDGWSTVYEIAVDKTRRGEHIGAGLLAAVPNPIRLKCPVDGAANDFYASQGFTCVRTEDGRKRRLNVWHQERMAI